MLFDEIIALFRKNHTERINIKYSFKYCKMEGAHNWA